MSLKFKYQNKGTITQEFGENVLNAYAPLNGHPGIDYDRGHGSFVSVDNAGYVYKILDGSGPQGYTEVALLVQHPDHVNMFMEIKYGHFLECLVKEGDTVVEGQFVIKQGNRGLVFHQGIQITLDMQKKGDTRGSHVHEQWRLVKRVSEIAPGKHYLNRGNAAYWRDGYYEIVANDNGYNGCINPHNYDHVDTATDRLRLYLYNLQRLYSALKNARLN